MTFQRDFKAGNAKLKTFEAATLAALETAVNDWFRGAGSPVVTEQRLLQFDLRPGGAGMLAYVLYTE